MTSPSDTLKTKSEKRQSIKRFRLSHLTLIYLIKAIQKGEYTLKELAEESGLHYLTVCEFTSAAHRERLIHICHWADDCRGRPMQKIYAWGPGKDAKRNSLTPKQRQERYRESQRAKQWHTSLTFKENIHVPV